MSTICSVAGCAFARPSGEDSNALTMVEMATDHHAWGRRLSSGREWLLRQHGKPVVEGHKSKRIHSRIERGSAEERLP